MLSGIKMSSPLPNFRLYHLRVYTLLSPNNPQGPGTRVVVGYPKSQVTKICKELSPEGNEEDCLNELHRRKWSEVHVAFAAILGVGEMLEQKTQPHRLVIPNQWFEPDAVTRSNICVWRENKAFDLPPQYRAAVSRAKTP
jgi:hypothetical protein